MPEDDLRPASSGSDVEIREARRTDIDALAMLETECFQSDRLSRRSFAALAKSRSAVLLVASCGPRLLGYALLRARQRPRPLGYALLLTRRGATTARLYSIAVAPEAAGTGIGRRLLAAAEAAARARGAERMRLEVRADNAAAIRFYERAGYHPAGSRTDYYQDGTTAHLYQRDLLAEAPASADHKRRARAA